jgi:hypothetical protein
MAPFMNQGNARMMSEAVKLRPDNFHTLSEQEQWQIDKELGILDHDPQQTSPPEREPVPFQTFGRRMQATTSVHERGAILMEAVRELAWRCGKVEETDELIRLYQEAPDA